MGKSVPRYNAYMIPGFIFLASTGLKLFAKDYKKHISALMLFFLLAGVGWSNYYSYYNNLDKAIASRKQQGDG